MAAINIFVSYSHADAMWVQAGNFGLIPWLARSLEDEGVVFWFDHELKRLPGEVFRRKIEAEIDRADFALLLISHDFVRSKFIREVELPRIRERFARKELSPIPILVGWKIQANATRWLNEHLRKHCRM